MNASTPIAPVALGYEPIDVDHQAFARLVEELRLCDDVAFVAKFSELVRHTEAHFEHENRLMDTYGFSALLEHKGEHRRVLGELLQFEQRAKRGLVPFARAFVNERLLPWFELHLVTMDSALAAHLRTQLSLPG